MSLTQLMEMHERRIREKDAEIEELAGIIKRTEIRSSLEHQAKQERTISDLQEAIKRCMWDLDAGMSREDLRSHLSRSLRDSLGLPTDQVIFGRDE